MKHGKHDCNIPVCFLLLFVLAAPAFSACGGTLGTPVTQSSSAAAGSEAKGSDQQEPETAAGTVEASVAASEPQAATEPDDTAAEGGYAFDSKDYNTVQSVAGRFSFDCNRDYLTAETAGGAIRVYLLGQDGTVPYLEISVIDGTDAAAYLKECASAAAAQLGTDPPEEWKVQELAVQHRRLSSVSYAAAETQTETALRATHFAEAVGGGKLLSYLGVSEMGEIDFVSEALMTAVRTMQHEGIALQSEADPEDPRVLDDAPGYESGDFGTVLEEGFFGDQRYVLMKMPSGDLRYVFNDVLALELPESWEGKFEAGAAETGNSLDFYHKASREKAQEMYGADGGWLFSIGYATDQSYKELPSCQEIGTADGGTYYFAFPTDVQGYMDDGPVWAEWMELMDDMNYVENSAFLLSAD